MHPLRLTRFISRLHRNSSTARETPRRPSRWNLVLGLILAAGAAAPASRGQVTLFDNTAFAGGAGTAIPVALNQLLGDSFSTGATDVTLSSFTAVLDLNGAATGATTFSLYTDDSGAPGTLLTTLGTIDDTSLTNSFADYTLSGLSYSVSASTRYWIMATATGNAQWDTANDDSGTGVAGEFVIAGGTVYPDSVGSLNMSVVATSAVPEPASSSLIGGSLALALGWIATRRRRC